MTHFGITALGSQNGFQSGLCSALGLNVFSEEEFKLAFKKCDKDGSGFITIDEVEDMLNDCYGFPPLEEEVEMFMTRFDLNHDGKVSWEEFCTCLNKIKSEVGSKANTAKEYTSFEKMRADRFKHVRMNHEVQGKYKLPMTSSQGVGFYHKDEQQKEITKQVNYPISKCHETKYADEMIRTGFLFN